MNGSVDGRIRRAKSEDIPAIARLMQRAQAEDGIPRISETEVAALLKQGEMIVLGVTPDELAAAACLTTSHGHGHLAFLVVDPEIDGVEPRMRAVAAAMSEAERCEPRFEPMRFAS